MHFLKEKLYFIYDPSLSQNFFWEIASKGVFGFAKIRRVLYNIWVSEFRGHSGPPLTAKPYIKEDAHVYRKREI